MGGRPTVCGRRRASAASFDGAVVDRALVRLDGATTLCPCSPRSPPSLIIGSASPRRRWSWEATGTKADEPVCGSRGRATDPPLYVCVADFNRVQEVHRDREEYARREQRMNVTTPLHRRSGRSRRVVWLVRMVVAVLRARCSDEPIFRGFLGLHGLVGTREALRIIIVVVVIIVIVVVVVVVVV